MDSPAGLEIGPQPAHTALMYTTLAQGVLDALSIADPQPLKASPVWDTYIFEQPWPLAGVLLVVAVAYFLKGKGRIRTIGAPVALALAIAVVAAGSLVTTAGEHIKASTRALVAAVAIGNLTVLDAELEDSAKLYSFLHNDGITKTAILDEVTQRFRAGAPYAIKEHSIIDLAAARDGTNVGRALVKVRVIPEAAGFPFFSWWLLDYRRDDKGRWRVVRMEPQSMTSVKDARARR